MENGRAMQGVENGGAVSHPSHSPLENAGEAGVSHISHGIDGRGWELKTKALHRSDTHLCQKDTL